MSKRKQKIPVLAVGGAVLTAIDFIFGKPAGYEGWQSLYGYAKLGDYRNMIVIAKKQAKEVQTWVPLVGGAVGSTIASRYGLNQKLSMIPMIKL